MQGTEALHPAPEVLLKQGDSGEPVKRLHRQLRRIGYRDLDGELPGDVDFNDRTRRAVEAFQYDYGLAVDGIVDIKTAAALRHAEHRVKWLTG
ncbi:peptidoglycan-binding domain-containing protein [Dyella mobilis]|uniref:Peptidoglycan-binding protein n=1 Tax=Dyella mobilis TaxID=1849582 RepID=A0ABS2KD55_9GAMM|nr:peptidoglycan-binding domain-containing protein [Dyella mobilis]MBM7129111.1 peptidoglycan-binding protein [Dyella mobilis]GLQ98405.1 hypothetical protein GCM10007863_28250 [Dyella mobilis]